MVEALQPAAGLLVRESTPVRFQEVACGRDCPADAGGIGAGGAVGTGRTGTRCGWAACWRAVWNSRCKSCWVTCT